MQIKELSVPSAGSVPYLNVGARASWGAILVGAVVSTAVFLTLATLGAGIGLMSAPAAEGPRTLGLGLGIGAVVWYLVCSVVAFYCGGWFSGRLTGIGRVSESVVHGVSAWAVVTVATAFLMMFTAGKAVSGAFGLLGQGLDSAATAAAAIGEEGLRDAPAGLSERAGEAKRRIEAATEGLRDAPAPIQQGSKAVGTAALIAFLGMTLQAVSAAYGARAGTRVLRPSGAEAYRR